MRKPVEAIERMRNHFVRDGDVEAILAYLDSIPEGAVPVVWPAELTRERLVGLANYNYKGFFVSEEARGNALRALAAIAPKREKRKMNLWQQGNYVACFPEDFDPNKNSGARDEKWRKVTPQPVEIEE